MRLFLILLILASSNVLAANRHVRPTADCANNGDGTTWSCAGSPGGAGAFTGFPTSFTRGDIYYFADGTYSPGASVEMGTAQSGTTLIILRKATVASHGIATGWSDTLGDGQAEIDTALQFSSGYWTIDGATRNETDWSQRSAYGFRVTGGFWANTSWFSSCADNLTVQYVDAGGEATGDPPTGGVDQVFYIGAFSESCDNWLLSRNHIHNSKTTYHLNGGGGGNCPNGITIEYSFIEEGYSKESIRGQGCLDNMTVRFNIFKNSCQGGAEPCTAIIGLFDGDSWANALIYGNVFYNTVAPAGYQDGVLVIGGTTEGSAVTGGVIYNNTFSAMDGSGSSLTILTRGTVACRNNLGYDTGGSLSYSCSTASNNINAGADPFVDYAGGDFHLSAATANGFSLSSPYDVDMDGVTRGGDGNWDSGAFEYEAGGSPTPNAPTNLRLISWLGTLLGLSVVLGIFRSVYGKSDFPGGGLAARSRVGRMARQAFHRLVGQVK